MFDELVRSADDVWRYVFGLEWHTHYLAVAGFIAGLAALLTNLSKIAGFARNALAWRNREKLDQPILISLRYSGDDAIGHSESKRALLDISISNPGRDRYLFDRIEIRHWPGWLRSIETGQLKSAGKYSFDYTYNSHETHHLDPPLVLQPGRDSILRFKIALVGQGEFPQTGGYVRAKLLYVNGTGRQGALLLLTIDEVTYKDYPDARAKLLRKRSVEVPKFDSVDGTQTEAFKLTPNGGLVGKPI